MRRALIVGVLAALAAGCATQAAMERSAQLAAGMTTVQASAVLGVPNRTIQDGSRESWQYCWPGMVSDDYLVAWFEDSRLTDWVLSPSYDFGTCSQQMGSLRWPEDRPPEVPEETAPEEGAQDGTPAAAEEPAPAGAGETTPGAAETAPEAS